MKPIVAGAAIAIAVAYAWGTTKIFVSPFADPAGPRAYPYLLAALLVFGAVVILIEWQRERGAAQPEGSRIRWSPLLPVAGWTLLYILAFEPIGYLITTSIYLIVLMAFFNPGKTFVNVTTSIGFSAVSYGVLAKLLDAQLPSGMLLGPLLSLFHA